MRNGKVGVAISRIRIILRMLCGITDERDFMREGMEKLLPLLVISALCGLSMAFKYPSIRSVGPYTDPGIGGTTCALYHSVSAAHSLHSAVDSSWKVGTIFTQPSSVIEQGFVVIGTLYLLWFAASAMIIITYFILSSVIAKIQPYSPDRLLEGEIVATKIKCRIMVIINNYCNKVNQNIACIYTLMGTMCTNSVDSKEHACYFKA